MSFTASIGVDVDDLKHYCRIHAIDESHASDAIWRLGVPRFLELFAQAGIKATFYCVAEDVENDANAEILKRIVAEGHEVANHTWHHPYALIRLSDEERLAEVVEGKKRLENIAQCEVRGFRSPGYHTTTALQRDLKTAGHIYDSSVFPCVPYVAAKAGILALMSLRGQQSRSIQGSYKVLLAPRSPYFAKPESPWTRAKNTDGEGLWQYPVSVACGCPLIGTAFTAIGRLASVGAVKTGLRLSKHITLEFHGIDLLELADVDSELSVQPDLRVSLEKKRSIFKAVLETLAPYTRRLDELALERAQA